MSTYHDEKEKHAVIGEHVEYSSEPSLENAGVSSVNEKALVRKTDYHLVPWLSLLYLLSFLDRESTWHRYRRITLS
jgi:hypothetical protein